MQCVGSFVAVGWTNHCWCSWLDRISLQPEPENALTALTGASRTHPQSSATPPPVVLDSPKAPAPWRSCAVMRCGACDLAWRRGPRVSTDVAWRGGVAARTSTASMASWASGSPGSTPTCRTRSSSRSMRPTPACESRHPLESPLQPPSRALQSAPTIQQRACTLGSSGRGGLKARGQCRVVEQVQCPRVKTHPPTTPE